jgi:pilus assembly protein CpaD
MKMYKMSALVALLVAGCTPEVAQWTPAESPKENKVERAVFKHHVHFPAHNSGLGKAERKKLSQFLKEKASNPFSVTVVIEEHGGHSEERIKEIEKVILLHGVPYDLIEHEMLPPEVEYTKDCKHLKKGSYSGVTVTVERYLVITPACANFSEQIGNANQTHAGSNFGCATEANFGMMVANPRDIIRGRTTSNYDGTVMAAGVQRYHEDKIKKLIDTSTTVAPGSLGSSTPAAGTGSTSGATTGSY